ncbi:hypothetical protein ACFWWN_32900, partial [Streptomyces sp. NPDC059082]
MVGPEEGVESELRGGGGGRPAPHAPPPSGAGGRGGRREGGAPPTALEGLAAHARDPLPLLAEALSLFEELGVAEDVVDLLLRRAAVHEAAGDAASATRDRHRAARTAHHAGLR